MEEEYVRVTLPPGASVVGDALVVPASRGRFLIGELVRALGEQELDEDQPTHLAHSPVLGLVPVSIITANQQAVLVRGHLYGRVTSPVRVSKADLFPYFEDLVTPGL